MIAKEELAVANDKIKAEKVQKEAALAQAKALANALLNKGVDIETHAKIMEVTPKKSWEDFWELGNSCKNF